MRMVRQCSGVGQYRGGSVLISDGGGGDACFRVGVKDKGFGNWLEGGVVECF